ncbi:hypothetical protein E2562_022719 [Oryza meyeriana var. granulata]|uniref:DUF7378 domain-containing protein n=1 Tax=Oryza meyeriana var. granulata TaxID=110450 RepID=A0A6G1E0Y2_9ORYZ|nr:hypothetical protein E2562_022719 [Oryza meyeriana var. granulata]
MALGFWHTIPAFYSSAPWRVPMWLSWGVYMSLASWVDFYVELFLPLTPLALEKAFFYGGVLFGSVALGVMELAVLATCADARVLAGCTCVVAACITGVVVFWARIACVYRD